ncbi:MAG: hypothetical protein Q9225_002074 [Loekoesia sp. 1 TL-2023]
MHDLPTRIAKALAPEPLYPEASQFDCSLAVQYAAAYTALLHHKRFESDSLLHKLRSRILSSNSPASQYRTLLLCKALLLGATFESRIRAFDALEKMGGYLAGLQDELGEKGKMGEGMCDEEELEELWELRDEMKGRMEREREVDVVKETRWGYGTTVWEVRLTRRWLWQTAAGEE